MYLLNKSHLMPSSFKDEKGCISAPCRDPRTILCSLLTKTFLAVAFPLGDLLPPFLAGVAFLAEPFFVTSFFVTDLFAAAVLAGVTFSLAAGFALGFGLVAGLTLVFGFGATYAPEGSVDSIQYLWEIHESQTHRVALA